MRIAVVTSSPPMAEGGHMVIARELTRALREAGHDAHIIVTPQNRFGHQASAYLATWLTDLTSSEGRPIDQVISLRYPSYAVRHRRHVCWLNHTMREYYDRWPEFSAAISWRNRIKESVRRALIHRADRHFLLHGVQRRFAISATVQSRLERWGQIPSEVLHPPAPARPYRCDGYGDYLFAVSRLTPLKRFDLLLEALAHPAARGIRAVIAGEGEARDQLLAARRRLGLETRVEFVGRVDDAQLLDHLARCRAVAFTPLDEDFGFVTVEAFASRKAVVTCTDSGGPTELVTDGVHGLVCEPAAAALAAGLRRVMDDAAAAERMGQAGAARAATLRWDATVHALLHGHVKSPV
jgi:glycosyltransferase involved in cell wall biosynthesis